MNCAMTKSTLFPFSPLLLSSWRLWSTALGVILAVLRSASPVLSAPPAEGPTEHTLANGLTVVLVEDHWHPIDALEVCYSVGSSDDPYGHQVMYHLLVYLTYCTIGL